MDGEEDHSHLSPGDFVWGKLKNQHWWPGQVHHPSSASDAASQAKPKDAESAVLVAFFGNGMFAWCDAAQLKPFVAEFDGLVRQSRGKGFVAAVEAALDELGRCLEMEMTCECVREESRRKLDRSLVVNAGIKDGVAAPKGRVHGLPIGDLRRPREFFRRFRDVACDVSSSVGLLESAVFRSCVAVYWSYLGRYATLPEWNEWKGIAEDGAKAGNAARMETSVGSRSHHKTKKERSMAELIAETGLDVNASADGEEEEEKSEPSVGKSRKKRKEVVGEELIDADAGDEAEEGDQTTGRRERKKSKYLCPPYTMVDHGSGNSVRGPASMKYEDSETGQLLKNRAMVRCSKRRFVLEENSSVNELLLELRLTALDSMYLEESEFDSVIRGFFDRCRSSFYITGSDYDDYSRSFICSVDAANARSPGMETGLFSQEGKPGGFQIVGDSEKGGSGSKSGKKRTSPGKAQEEIKVKTLGFDINVSVEGKSHGVAEGDDGLIDVNVMCPGIEANGLDDDNEASEVNKPKKTRKRKSASVDDAAGFGEPRSIGRPKKKSIGSDNVGSYEGRPSIVVHPVSVGQVSGDLENGKAEKKRGMRSKKIMPPPHLVQPYHGSALTTSPSVPKPPLDFVKTSLEEMITTLNESAANGEGAAESTRELKPETMGKLVDEMNELLKKVNRLLATTTNPNGGGSDGGVGGRT